MHVHLFYSNGINSHTIVSNVSHFEIESAVSEAQNCYTNDMVWEIYCQRNFTAVHVRVTNMQILKRGQKPLSSPLKLMCP